MKKAAFTAPTSAPNPVRIFVLHHPESALAKSLCDQIYQWFRLPSLEGIPVYVRSVPPAGGKVPLPITETPGVLNYLLPLVDANLVRDVHWQEYLVRLADGCETASAEASVVKPEREVSGNVLFPVALDTTAFNFPASISRLNYIRYETVPGASDAIATEEMLRHLTEALSRDLNGRLFPAQAASKLKVFISYARADGTGIPKALRDFIHGRTQCSAFFDENDIGFGAGFGEILEKGVGEQARALMVVRGDHYADRPWCRWELSRYLRPRPIPLRDGATVRDADPGERPEIEMFHPVLVVNALDQAQLTREIPELGHAPTVRWAPGREQLCFSMLLREVLFGARNVLAAGRLAARSEPCREPQLWLNRLPGPLLLHEILERSPFRGQDKLTVNYAGNGMPLIERRLLERSFPRAEFWAFHDYHRNLPRRMQEAWIRRDSPFANRVMCLASSDSGDLARLGYLDQHMRELLIHLMRPLVALGMDILYAGKPPKASSDGGQDPTNLTSTLLALVSDERNAALLEEDGSGATRGEPARGRLFNVSLWPYCDQVTAKDEAAWINLCSVHRVTPAAASLDPCRNELVEAPEKSERSYAFLATSAMVHSFGRKLIGCGFECPVPGHPGRRVEPAAYLMVGGKTSGFSGIMPGLFEEFDAAVRNRRPVYLLGGLGGAAGALAQALLGRGPRPSAFSRAHYLKARDNPGYATLMTGLNQMQKARSSTRAARATDEAFDRVWATIEKARQNRSDPTAVLRNGLTPEENRRLLTTEVTTEAVYLVWQGLERLFLGKPVS